MYKTQIRTQRPTLMLPKRTLNSMKISFWECRMLLTEETISILKKNLKS